MNKRHVDNENGINKRQFDDERRVKIIYNSQEPHENAPPAAALFLARILAPIDFKEPFLGDLTEIYNEIAFRDGVEAANKFYWLELMYMMRFIGGNSKHFIRERLDLTVDAITSMSISVLKNVGLVALGALTALSAIQSTKNSYSKYLINSIAKKLNKWLSA